MSSAAIDVQGTTLGVQNDDSPPTFDLIGEIKSISGPSGKAATIDTSDFDSIAREKRPGLADYGDITLTIHFLPDDTMHTMLQTAYGSRTRLYFELTFSDSNTRLFYGYISGFSMNFAIDSVVEGSITILVDGALTAGT